MESKQANEHQRRVRLSSSKMQHIQDGVSRIPVAESSWNSSRRAVSLPATEGFSALLELPDTDSRGFSAVVTSVGPSTPSALDPSGHIHGRSPQLLKSFSEVAAHADVVTEISVCCSLLKYLSA